MASDSEEIEYQALDQRQQIPLLKEEPPSTAEDDESEISFHEDQGFMVHMSPDATKSQWNHVDDLDKFFVNVYDYHQRHGFQNMVLSESLQIVQFIFIVLFMTYLSWCVNYPELFDELPHNITYKKTFGTVTYPLGSCIAKFNFLTWLLLLLCSLFLVGRGVKTIVNVSNYIRTRNFFISALNIETKELSNMTWHEVQARLLEVQKEEQICIHKQELTQLDIYHRILRFKNYLVAMVNKNLIPLRFRIPFIGEYALLTHGMRFNLEFLLYWSPWSIFINSYTMREEYKTHLKRRKLADQLSTHISILALLNFVLCPFIFLYQIIYFFFRYTEFVKRSPSFLGSRQWANYGRLYLRHFNELDHELHARLNRAYVPSKLYMNSFTSPSVILLAKYVAFFAGAPAAVLFFLGILDFNDVTKVEHLFTVASVCGMVATLCSAVIPDENEVHCPERLMMSILAQIHYMPDQWKGRAHTSSVRDEFSMLFQYKMVYILEELFSPLITPFWLFFALRPKTIQMVDFFRCFTVEVAGVGDVCSFAQMDIKKHGNPQWSNTKPAPHSTTKSQQAENGKIELSLMHFTATNPEWKPPQESTMFINEIKHEVQRELPALTSIIADPISLPSLGYVNPIQPLGLMHSMQHSFHLQPDMSTTLSVPGAGQSHKLRGGLSHLDGPVACGTNMNSSLTFSGSFHSGNYGLAMADEGQRELLSGNMSLSVLHMHDVHHRQRRAGRSFRQFSTEEPSIRKYPDSYPYQPPSREMYQVQHTNPRGISTAFHESAGLGISLSDSMILRQEPSDSNTEQMRTYLEMTNLNRGPRTGNYMTPDPEEDSPQAPQSLGQYFHQDDSGPSSLLPLGLPKYSAPLPPSLMSLETSPHPVGTQGPVAEGREGRATSDHMPQIKEDMIGEHEIDTSKI